MYHLRLTLHIFCVSCLSYICLLLWFFGCGVQIGSCLDIETLGRPSKGVCGSVYINTTESFYNLTNCTIIEGELHIFLIDYAEPSEYEDLHFPDLVEITDHLLIFRVFELRSLRDIFPNLSVIRGQKLFVSYALVAYDNPDLEELGLVKLTSIQNGAVRLVNNPKLCFIETVDWERIAPNVDVKEHVFQNNRRLTECPNQCPRRCVTRNKVGTLEERCWTRHDCQQMLSCPYGCSFCNGSQCCHPQCIGGCIGPRLSQCTSCKSVVQQRVNQPSVCASKCSPNMFLYNNRRCLTAQQCTNFTSLYYNTSALKVVMPAAGGSELGLCLPECPDEYMEDPQDQSRCIPCLSTASCTKVCKGNIIVDSVAAAQSLKGCTVINGHLEITIMGGTHISSEMEKNLGQIEEIRDYLRVHRSFALLSLHFFSSLRIIGGKNLYQQKFGLVVLDNLNLVELFRDGISKNLRVKNGTVLFHHNRKLCLDKINATLKDMDLNVKDKDGLLISRFTNGDLNQCKVQKLQLIALYTSMSISYLMWGGFNISDSRLLIHLDINYKESPEKDATIFEGRDACSSVGWRTQKHTPTKYDPKRRAFLSEFIYLTNLKVWTQYAVYIRTVTIASAHQGGSSDIIYIQTKTDYPTIPLGLTVHAVRPGELLVRWNPPEEPNGNVTHYEVTWQFKTRNRDLFDSRDYCKNRLEDDLQQEKEEDAAEDLLNESKNKTGECCDCPKTDTEKKQEARTRLSEIMFEDIIQNQLFISRNRSDSDAQLDNVQWEDIPSEWRKRRKREAGPIHSNMTYPPHSTRSGIPPASSAPVSGLSDTANTSKTAPDAVNKNKTDVETSNGGKNTTTVKEDEEKNATVEKYQVFKASVYAQEFVISNLGYFEEYSISFIAQGAPLVLSVSVGWCGSSVQVDCGLSSQVVACQEREVEDVKSRPKLCSAAPAIDTGRTLPSNTADNIDTSTVTFDDVKGIPSSVRVKWKDPPKPNSFILNYDLNVTLVDSDKVLKHTYCVTYKELKVNYSDGYLLEKLNHGKYMIQIRVTSLAGSGKWTDPLFFHIESADNLSLEALIGGLVGAMVVIIATIIVVWLLAKRRFSKQKPVFTSANPEYYDPDYMYEPDEWEVDRSKVELLRELGQGSFGMVYEGIVTNLVSGGSSERVAVKTVNEHATDYERIQFLQEASVMKAFNCHHVVKLRGVVSKGQPALVLMELMSRGDLKNFLRMHRPDEEDNDGLGPPTLKQILQMAGEIADGMSYLADKRFVHRDLAARNCMVGDDFTVKIGDFGMTRDIYETDYYRKGNRGLLPVRWMAPESLKDGVFTSMSDVWSFGVVMWEMATLAAQPYQGLSNEEVLKYVGSGKIMEKPEGCPNVLYDLMLKCWRYRSKQRPTFKEIIESLVPELDPSFKHCSYFFSEESMKHDEAKRQKLKQEADEGNEDQLNDSFEEQSLPFMGTSATSDVVGHGFDLEEMYPESGFWQLDDLTCGDEPHSGESYEYRDLMERGNGVGFGVQPDFLYNRRESLSSAASQPNSEPVSSSDDRRSSSVSSHSNHGEYDIKQIVDSDQCPVPMQTTDV